MVKINVYAVLGVLSLLASFAMYMIGSNNDHLTELKDFWWTPLPLAAIFLILAVRASKTK